jgi:hypothetical protein
VGVSIEFHGGMMDGKVKQLPMMSDVFGPIPFSGCSRGRSVRNVYELAGWRPSCGVWV